MYARLTLLCSIKAYTAQLLCGPFDSLISIIRDEASLGLHIANLERRSFLHFFWLSSWFMQFMRHQDEARVSKASKCALCCCGCTCVVHFRSTCLLLQKEGS